MEALLSKQRTLQIEELLKPFANGNRTYDEVTPFLKEEMTWGNQQKTLKEKEESQAEPRKCEWNSFFLKVKINGDRLAAAVLVAVVFCCGMRKN